MKDHDKFVFGAGVGAGLLGVYLIIELLPIALLAGAGYLTLQGLKHTKENSQWQEHGPDQK